MSMSNFRFTTMLLPHSVTMMMMMMMLVCSCGCWVQLGLLPGAHAWIVAPSPTQQQSFRTLVTTPFSPTTHQQGSALPRGPRKHLSSGQMMTRPMGLLDSVSNFLRDRGNDFVQLDKDDSKEYGPGPLILMYHVPSGITNEEVLDIVADSAPLAFAKGVALRRIVGPLTLSQQHGDDDNDQEGSTTSTIFDQTLQTVLEDIVKQEEKSVKKFNKNTELLETDAGILAAECPVLIFSGFRNHEMMDTYNLLGNEIYQETAGRATPACAIAVPKAMNKPLRQVLEEITGDHRDAMKQE
jgi:hypothetical protein